MTEKDDEPLRETLSPEALALLELIEFYAKCEDGDLE